MTRTDVMASSRPRTPGTSRAIGRSSTVRALVALPVILLMALAAFTPGMALAAGTTNSTSEYGTPPPTPSTTKSTPATGTSPSKEEGTPATTTPKEAEPTTSSAPEKEAAKTLPFTGFDLRWSFGIGLLLIAAGFSIVVAQRRRGESRR
jgi:hypothetical protein